MSGRAAAVGTFDGVHRGHMAVLVEVRDQAAQHGLEPVALTFDRHPLSVIAPERTPPALATPGAKSDLLRRAGVTPVVVPFDESLRALTAAEWMRKMHDDYGVTHLVVGYDNTFGSDGVSLSLADYRRLGAEAGITVVGAPYIEGVSSSAIRKALAAGDVEVAAAMLGRPYTLGGHVVTGNRLGRTIGFPTANLKPLPGLAVPADGVYSATALLPDGTRRKAVVNIGVRPTVRRGEDRTVEAHILDWEGDIYGMQMSLAFAHRLRDEKKFNSIEALRRQIAEDERRARGEN